VPASAPELEYYFRRSGVPTESLVRPPEAAQHLYVVTAPESTPTVDGWRAAQAIAGFPHSELLGFERVR